MYGYTGCDEYAHAHFIVVLTEHIAYLGKIARFFTCSSKADCMISPPLPPLSLSDFPFSLLDGFIPDLGIRIETVIYKLLKAMARMLLEKSHSGTQCISLCSVLSSPLHCVGYRNTNRPTLQTHTPDIAG